MAEGPAGRRGGTGLEHLSYLAAGARDRNAGGPSDLGTRFQLLRSALHSFESPSQHCLFVPI